MISLKALHCWVNLVQSQSFSLTADKMALSQPSISKMIASLEEELGVALLLKGESGRKRSVQPTAIGQQLYERALLLLQQETLLYQEVADYQQLKSGTLRIGMSLLGSRLLTPVFFHFHRQWPHIELAFIEAGSCDIETALLNNQLDVGQLMAPFSDEFESIFLCSYPLMVVLPRDRAQSLPVGLPLRSLRNDPFILFTRGFKLYERILEACISQGFHPNIACRTSQWDLVRDMVAQKMGIALLPQYYTDEFDPNQFAAIPLMEPAIEWQLHMAWLRHKKTTPALKAWLNIVRQEFIQQNH